jgi:hypothetical protein
MSKPYHIYLDLDVLNSDTAPTSRAPVLSFEETRTQPFLEGSASDYFVSIVRFSIQTGTSLPVFIPRIATGATDNPTNDINKTIYTITMCLNIPNIPIGVGTSSVQTGVGYSSVEVSQSISYQPYNTAADLPRTTERRGTGSLGELLSCEELPGLDRDDKQDAGKSVEEPQSQSC